MASKSLLRTSLLLFLAAFFPDIGQCFMDRVDCQDPKPPSWLHATALSDSTFSLTWGGVDQNPPHCVAGYRVCLHQPAGDYDCIFVSCFSLGGCTANNNAWENGDSKLRTVQCAKFTVSVAAVFDVLGVDGRISESRVASFQAAPAGVTGLAAVETTGNSTRLEWRASTSPCADHYAVFWCSVATPWTANCTTTTKALSTDQTSFSITGLRPCTLYRVGVAIVAGSNGPKTDVAMIVTTPSTGVGAVRNLMVGVSENEVELTWEAVPEDRTCTADYEVCWQDESGRTSCRLDEPGAELHVGYCTGYNVSVRAVDISNDTSEPVTLPVRTGAEKVRNLTVTEVTSRNATITWTSSPSTVTCGTGYRLAWCAQVSDNDPQCEPSVRYKLSLNTTSYNLTGLHPCLPHRVQILTLSDGGAMSESSTVLVSTTLDDLGPPRDVQVTVVSSTVTMVEFSAPEDSGNCVSNYTGCLQNDEDPGAEPVCLPAPNQMYWVNWDNHTKPCTNYTLHLAVHSVDGRNASTSVSFTSGAEQVVGLKAANATSDTSPTAVRLTWAVSPDNKCVQGQQVSWGPADGNGTFRTASVHRDVTEMVLQDLEPCSQYVASVETLAPTAPVISSVTLYTVINVTAVSVANMSCLEDDSSAVLRVDAPNPPSCVDAYSVCWGRRGGGNSTCRVVSASGMTHVPLSGLSKGQEYNVSITPVAPGRKLYTNHTLQYTFTCSGCTSVFSANITALVLSLAVLRKLLVGMT